MPNEGGEWEFGMVVAAGQGDLYIDGVQVIDNSTQQTPSPLFECAGSIQEVGHFTVEAGKSYALEIRFSNQRPVPGQTIPMGRGAIEVGARRIRTTAELVNEAVEVAKQADVVIVAVGLNADWESEGYDRKNPRLPPGTDELVDAVLDVRSDSVVVLQSGTPLELPWVEKCSALLQAHYGGLEFGNGLADIIFGKANPSARLSMTYPFKASHNPANYNWGDEFGESRYGEGVFVGYRHYEATDREVMFPFGYGLSYHSSEITDIAIEKTSPFTKPVDILATCHFTLENLSEIPGREVVQLYIGPPDSEVRRPVKERKTYCKLALKAHEKKKAQLNIPLEAFAYFNGRMNQWHVEKGTYRVFLGFSSQNIRAEEDIQFHYLHFFNC
ncbi:glycosyl hydrolase family 3 C-terminal domain-containing protein [Aspergillus keveii]|uniref:beta-glucosidase n=1 Tax=Aspergillus keveii TaxID=714993 RepID=A0ABR4FJC4_9EURO